MAIGILAFVISVILLGISAIGIGSVEPPVKRGKQIEYPFPEEL